MFAERLRRWRAGRPARITAAALGAVLAAEAATWLLRPRGEVLDPVPVSERAYFDRETLERNREFRDGQRELVLAALAVEGGVLVLLALWRPPPLRRALARAGRRPLMGGAAAGAAISLALAVAALPTGVAAHERARDAGLATQDVAAWLGDRVKGAGIGALLAAAAGLLAVALARRLGRRWWIGGSAVVVAFAVVYAWLAPVLLAPLFNRFERLPPGPARSDVLRLGRAAGVEIGEVYRVDASRRSTGLNAYVDGIGPTKRVVLYDNLLREGDRAEVRSVVAHELAHVQAADIARGIAWIALVAPFAVLFVQVVATGVARRNGEDPASPAAIPAMALALALAVLVLGSLSNQLSRRVEARADTVALELTGEPRAFIALQRRLAESNLSDPDPPAAYHRAFGTHPTTIERIGAALAFKRGAEESR